MAGTTDHVLRNAMRSHPAYLAKLCSSTSMHRTVDAGWIPSSVATCGRSRESKGRGEVESRLPAFFGVVARWCSVVDVECVIGRSSL